MALRVRWLGVRAALAFPLLAAPLSGGCKTGPHPDVDGVEPMRPSYLSEHFREAGTGEGGITLTSTMPEDFPPAVPLYPGAHLTLGGKEGTPTGKRSWSVTVETPDSKDKVHAYYATHLQGFSPTSDLDLGDSELSVWHADAMDLDLVIGKGTDGKTTVTLDAVER